MVPMGEDFKSSPVPAETFAAHLSALKQQGSALLVVGDLAPEQYRHLCHRMLGDATTAPRRRVLVTTNPSMQSPQARVPPAERPIQSTPVRHITYAVQARTTTPDIAASPRQVPTEHIVAPDLSALGIAIADAIHELQQDTSEFAAAELRVCFDSLRPVLSAHEIETVFQFLHLLIGRIQDVRGMGHFHLPVAPDRDAVRRLTPLFDAVVTLRQTGDQLQQRWRLPDEELTSPWLSV